jgi:hypothetical protein
LSCLSATRGLASRIPSGAKYEKSKGAAG